MVRWSYLTQFSGRELSAGYRYTTPVSYRQTVCSETFRPWTISGALVHQDPVGKPLQGARVERRCGDAARRAAHGTRAYGSMHQDQGEKGKGKRCRTRRHLFPSNVVVYNGPGAGDDRHHPPSQGPLGRLCGSLPSTEPLRHASSLPRLVDIFGRRGLVELIVDD